MYWGGYIRGVPTPWTWARGVVHPCLHHTYGRQAGGTHPTGMLSCLLDFLYSRTSPVQN